MSETEIRLRIDIMPMKQNLKKKKPVKCTLLMQVLKLNYLCTPVDMKSIARMISGIG